MSDCVLTVKASAEDAGARLDAFIGCNTDELSRSYAVKLIEKGRVSINGQAVTSKKRAVSEGDKVVIDMPEPEPLEITAENIPLDIVYEDEDVAVINKPRGMVVHPGPGNPSGTLVRLSSSSRYRTCSVLPALSYVYPMPEKPLSIVIRSIAVSR